MADLCLCAKPRWAIGSAEGTMCRLFGMSGGREPLRATFWLLEAPDSLAAQSRHNPDGYGLGTFGPDGEPRVDKRAAAAYRDHEFAREAREGESRTFVAHVRLSYTGAIEHRNTQPFVQAGRLFAHNGWVGDLPKLERELAEHAALVGGETDSERLFALVTREAERDRGDVTQGIVAAARWAAAELPLFAINVIVATDGELWALRYPESDELFLLERAPGGHHGDRHLDVASERGTVRVRSHALIERAAVIVASERMSDDPAWRLLEPGELVHVDPDLRVTSHRAVEEPPAHPVSLEELLADAPPHTRALVNERLRSRSSSP
jgi:predicted glutamine amidotransferase